MNHIASAKKEEAVAHQSAKPKPGPVVAAGQQLPPAHPSKPVDAASSNGIDVKKLSSQRLRAGAGTFPFGQYGRASAEEAKAKDFSLLPGRPEISQPCPIGGAGVGLHVEVQKE